MIIENCSGKRVSVVMKTKSEVVCRVLLYITDNYYYIGVTCIRMQNAIKNVFFFNIFRVVVY